MFTGYIKIKLSSFQMSDYSLQWMEIYGKNDNYIVYKNRWDYKKKILKREKKYVGNCQKTNCSFSKE